VRELHIATAAITSALLFLGGVFVGIDGGFQPGIPIPPVIRLGDRAGTTVIAAPALGPAAMPLKFIDVPREVRGTLEVSGPPAAGPVADARPTLARSQADAVTPGRSTVPTLEPVARPTPAGPAGTSTSAEQGPPATISQPEPTPLPPPAAPSLPAVVPTPAPQSSEPEVPQPARDQPGDDDADHTGGDSPNSGPGSPNSGPGSPNSGSGGGDSGGSGSGGSGSGGSGSSGSGSGGSGGGSGGGGSSGGRK
jgi:hypothetical protein